MIWAIIFFSLAGLAGWGMWAFVCSKTCSDEKEMRIIKRTQRTRDKIRKRNETDKTTPK